MMNRDMLYGAVSNPPLFLILHSSLLFSFYFSVFSFSLSHYIFFLSLFLLLLFYTIPLSISSFFSHCILNCTWVPNLFFFTLLCLHFLSLSLSLFKLSISPDHNTFLKYWKKNRFVIIDTKWINKYPGIPTAFINNYTTRQNKAIGD